MKKIAVEVRDDHLELLSRAKPMLAISELIWNALDAEATEIRVEFAENDLGGLDAIRVRDNGHGLSYDRALVEFRNLGGSWKRDGGRTATRKRMLHGQYGKGRFRAFALGNRAQWSTSFEQDGRVRSYNLVGHAATLGEFELSDPVAAPGAAPGTVVEIADIPLTTHVLRGGKAVQEVTDIFALYLHQYPDVRIVYDGVRLDPANAQDRSTDIDLDEMVMPNGERVQAELTIVEWNIPGKRGIMLCDAKGFALHPAAARVMFRGFSYTAYLKSDHFVALEKEGLLQLEDMAPDLKILLDETRLRLRQHFTLREIERAQDTLDQWRVTGLYPYRGDAADRDEELERRVFDIYAAHLGQLGFFTEAAYPAKRLMLRLLQEMVNLDPVRVTRLLDELLAFPEEKQEEISELIQT